MSWRHVVGPQPGHRRNGRGEDLVRAGGDTHTGRLVDDRPPRPGGGVGQEAVPDTFTREPGEGPGGAGHRLVAHVDDTVEIEQHSAHVSIMRAMQLGVTLKSRGAAGRPPAPAGACPDP